jgi:hypothetical protein
MQDIYVNHATSPFCMTFEVHGHKLKKTHFRPTITERRMRYEEGQLGGGGVQENIDSGPAPKSKK